MYTKVKEAKFNVRENEVGENASENSPLTTWSVLLPLKSPISLHISVWWKIFSGCVKHLLFLLEKKKKKKVFVIPTSPPVLSFLPTVQEEVNRGSILLPVCTSNPGKHHIRPECPTEEPWWGPRREKLPDPSPALAHRQPRHPLFRCHCILLNTFFFLKWQLLLLPGL